MKQFTLFLYCCATISSLHAQTASTKATKKKETSTTTSRKALATQLAKHSNNVSLSPKQMELFFEQLKEPIQTTSSLTELSATPNIKYLRFVAAPRDNK